jgi:hypothetical protein
MPKLTKTKDEIIKKSDELAIEYEAKYKGCGECTFMAVLDALRWGGLEIIPKEMEDRLFSAVCLTTAGIGLICDGNCGAVASGALAIGLALGIQGGPQGGPLYFLNLNKGFATVRNTLVKRCYDKYNSILCTNIQRKWFGKAWDLTRDDMNIEFLGITHGCAIMEITMWTTEIILDEFEKGNVKGYVGSPQVKA